MKLTINLFVVTLFVITGEVAFAQDAVRLSPKMYTILLENDRVRVLEFRCKPGEREPMHSHPAIVAYSLSASKFKSTTPDGNVTEGESKAGTAVWGDAVTHTWECLGPGEQRTIITELKGGAKPAQDASTSKATPLVEKYLHEFWGKGEMRAIHQIFSPEVTMRYLGRTRALTPARHEAGARAFRGAFPDLAIVAPTVVPAGDYVTAYTIWTGTHQGPISQLGGRSEEMLPTGRRLEWTILYMFRIADGRIVEMWEEWDEGGFIERLRR